MILSESIYSYNFVFGLNLSPRALVPATPFVLLKKCCFPLILATAECELEGFLLNYLKSLKLWRPTVEEIPGATFSTLSPFVNVRLECGRF